MKFKQVENIIYVDLETIEKIKDVGLGDDSRFLTASIRVKEQKPSKDLFLDRQLGFTEVVSGRQIIEYCRQSFEPNSFFNSLGLEYCDFHFIDISVHKSLLFDHPDIVLLYAKEVGDQKLVQELGKLKNKSFAIVGGLADFSFFCKEAQTTDW